MRVVSMSHMRMVHAYPVPSQSYSCRFMAFHAVDIIADGNKIVERNTKLLYPNPCFRRQSLLDQHPMTLDQWCHYIGPCRFPGYEFGDEPFHTIQRIHSRPELYPNLQDFPPDYLPGVVVQDHMLYNMARRNNIPHSLFSRHHFLYAVRESPNSDYATLFIAFYCPIGTRSNISKRTGYSFIESLLPFPRRYMWAFHILNKKIRRYTKLLAGNEEECWIPVLELRKADGSLHKGCVAVLLGYFLLLREHFVSELWKDSIVDMVPSTWRCPAFDEYTLRDILYVELHTLEDRERIVGVFTKEVCALTMMERLQILQKDSDKEMSRYNQTHLLWSDGYLNEEPISTTGLNNLCDPEITALLSDKYNKDVPSAEQLLYSLYHRRRRLPKKNIFVEIQKRRSIVRRRKKSLQ